MPKSKSSAGKTELPILQPQAGTSGHREKKSGRGRIRALVLIGVHLLILLHLTHYWLAGRSLSPVEPSEVMYTIELGQLNAGAIFFGIAILSTAIFGRFFCGWACHLVALQDLCGYCLRRIGIRPKPFRSRLLTLIPFLLAFYMFFWPTLKRLVRGDQHPGLTNHLLTENFWYTFPGPAISILTFVVCGGLVVYLLGNKGFCTYACPYGALFSISDRVAPGRIRVTDDCSHCGQCTAHCTSNVKIHTEVKNYGMVIDPGCMKCMDCVSVCPNDALYFGLTEREGARTTKSKPAKQPRTIKHYDFTIREELFGLIVAGVSVFALRGLYDLIPMLLATATGAMTAYSSIMFIRIFRKRDLRIQNFKLKSGHRLTNRGLWVVVLLGAWFVFNVHSVVVQYYRYDARNHISMVANTSWPALMDGRARAALTDEDRANIDSAIASYKASDRLGILDVAEIKYGLTVSYILKNDLESAETYLRQAHECDPSVFREMIAEFLVSQGRQEEAAQLLGRRKKK